VPMDVAKRSGTRSARRKTGVFYLCEDDMSSVDRLTAMQKVIEKGGFSGYFNKATTKT
jgi:hypothetical protein